jgi:hypothetical protein
MKNLPTGVTIPTAAVIRKVASGTVSVPGFDSATVGPFDIDDDECPDAWVQIPNGDNPAGSTWGDSGKCYWIWGADLDELNKVRLTIFNQNGVALDARWIIYAGKM